MKYLPISLLVDGQSCLVVGAGSVALRKTKYLVDAGAKLTIVASDWLPEFTDYAKLKGLTAILGNFEPKLLDGVMLVIAATDNESVNQQIAALAKDKGILVNVVDQPQLCNFTMPSVIDRMPLSVAISSGGASPVLVRMIREKLEWMLPEALAELTKSAGEMRADVAKKFPDFSSRRQFWEDYFEKALGWNVSQNLTGEEKQLSLQPKSQQSSDTQELLNNFQPQNSKLYLIDLGDGELDYLPLKTIQTLHKVDDIYFESDTPESIVKLFRRDSEKYLSEESSIDIDYVANKVSNVSDASNDGLIVFVKLGHYFEDNEEQVLSNLKGLKLPVEIIKAIRV